MNLFQIPYRLPMNTNGRHHWLCFDVVMHLRGPPSHGITAANCSPISVPVILVELDASML